ncbi:MAG TPA: hypothetical protein VMW71_02935 [Thermoplasmata archaeon]|nr:hypothetical protein [Thermoplasmata archaeon]
MIDLFFTGILTSVILIWVLGVRCHYIGRLAMLFRRYMLAVSAVFWVGLIVFAVVFVVNFDYFDRIHDIDEAVQAAVSSYPNGINPYEEFVVPRFQGKYAPNVLWTMGPYNYLPLDLFVYVGFHEALGWIGSPIWFVLTNLVLSGVAFVILRDMLKADWIIYAPIAGIVMLFYSFDNASLTLLLMVISMFVYGRTQWHPGALAILIMALATMTKVFAGIPLVVLILFELQLGLKKRDWRRLGDAVVATACGAGIALLLMLPFGISTVLDAAVFFHASDVLREGTSVGGTVLSEIMLESEYYSMVSAAIVFAVLIISMRLRSLNDRVLLTITAFLMVAVKSSLAPLVVAGLFLVLRLKESTDAKTLERIRSEIRSAEPDPDRQPRDVDMVTPAR